MISFNLESPQSGETIQGLCHFQGWCFAPDGPPVKGVRIAADAFSVDATYGLSRPDVAESLKDPQIEGCGFQASRLLPQGTHQCRLEVKRDGAWRVISDFQLQIAEEDLMVSLDTPTEHQVIAGRIMFSGWVFHPRYRIRRLKLVVHGQAFDCAYGLERQDVLDSFPSLSHVGTAGFEALVDVTPGSGDLYFEATLDNRTVARWIPFKRFTVRSRPWHAVVGRRVKAYGGLLRYIGRLAKERRERLGRGPRLREVPVLMREVRAAYGRWRGSAGSQYALPTGFQLPDPQDPYTLWCEMNQWRPRLAADLRRRLKEAKLFNQHGQWADEAPLLSIVMPIYNPPLEHLNTAIESLQNQVYSHWELCLADDASPDPAVKPFLETWAAKEPRIRLTTRAENGNISAATNAAAALAEGTFLVLMDQDDALTRDALAEIALHMAENPEVDVIYSDDDKISESGNRFHVQFKPDWSPELLLSYMYFSHIFCIRRKLFKTVGGTRLGYEGSQDYDLALRVTEQARQVGHIPRVLYHWRVLPGSTAASADEKPASVDAGLRALQDALDRRDIQAQAYIPEWAAGAGIGAFSCRFPDTGPRVTLIIPTKNQADILRRCIDSLVNTTYRDYDVLIVDNESDDPFTIEYLAQQPHRVFRIGNPPGKGFNFAYINNRAVEQVDSEYVLFLNNDTEVIAPEWLSSMMGHVQMNGVGAVGARLYYPDDRIQHAGIVHGYYHGLAGPAFKLLGAKDFGYMSQVAVSRNYSAVTAACLLTPRALFTDLGMFDETNFGVAYNDVDYCYRLVDQGYRCVYNADARLYHHEGYSRGFADNPQETANFRRQYAERRDPYYNPNLSLHSEAFQVRVGVPRPQNAKPFRALMCAFNLNWEGAPYSQFEMTRRLRDLGVIEPVVYCPEDGPLREAYEAEGMEIHIDTHPLSSAASEEEYDQSIVTFVDRIRNWNVDVVYGNTLRTFYAIDAAHRLNLPSIWNPRESEPWQTYFSDFVDPVAARALRCFQYPYRIVFVADATANAFAALNTHHNFTVVHNGLDMDRLNATAANWDRATSRRELNVPDDGVVVLLLGTVCARKGQKDLLLALKHLRPDLAAKLHVYIVGDRPSLYSDEAHALLGQLPAALHDRVHLVQETPQTALYYRAADIFVCTSRVESYPRVILEAMAYDLPIITTPVFGIVEQVQENVNARYYRPGDVQTLASHLEKLSGDGELRATMAAKSRHVLRIRNNFDDMASAYARIFQEAWFSANGAQRQAEDEADLQWADSSQATEA